MNERGKHINKAKSAKPMQSTMARRRHGPILEVVHLLIVWTNEQKHGIHIPLNQVTSIAKDFFLLEMLKNSLNQTPRSLQKQNCMA
jgi:hypothetical protein